MATCVIEQPSTTSNESSFLKLWNSLNHMAAKQPPNGIPQSSPSTSFTSDNRNPKRSASLPWTEEDRAAAEALINIMNKTSNSAPATLIKQENDPADILLHQLSKLCDTAQENVTVGNNITPFIFEADSGSSTLKSTHLANHLISCFVVGGEIRLCAPQVYSVILNDVSEENLAHWIREYQIVDQTASQDQFMSLKSNHAIPGASITCGLMTKTNAERLVGALIDPVNYRRLPKEKRMKVEPILIQHDCFGGCEARLFTALYPGPCVECIHCNCLMTTESFCRHSHNKKEHDPICHWGFDAVNWRNYVRVHDLVDSELEVQRKFNSFIHIESKGRETTLEEDLEAVASKKGNPMFNLTLPALASLLQAQQPTAGPSTSGIPQGLGNPQNNLMALLQLQALANGNNTSAGTSSTTNTTPSINQNLLSHLQSQITPQSMPTNSTLPLAQNLGLLSLQQQQLNVLRNVIQASGNGPNMDDSGIPRKRAHTLADPSNYRNAANAIVNKENPTNNMAFGTLPSDQQLVTLLSQLTTHDNVVKITELITNSITQRVKPVVDENERLVKERDALRHELEVKKELVARLMLRQQHFQVSLPQSTAPSVMETDEERIDVDA